MISRQQFFLSVLIILAMSLLLAGCVRPVPEGEATAVSSEPDTSDPNVGGGAGGDATAVPETNTDTETTEAPQDTASAAESSYPTEGEETSDEVTETAAEEIAAVVVAEEATTEEAYPVTETTTESETAPVDEPMTNETSTVVTDCPKEHVVQPGENLFRIGMQYGLSWVTLAQYNGITDPNNITVGQTIKIPCDGTTPPPVQPTPPPEDVTYYTVQPGDNLFRIGLKFGVSWVEIAEANGIVNPNNIYAGQVLKIPTSAPGPRPEFTHVVKQGETVYSISVQYGVPAVAIAEANDLQEPYVIYAGQTLIIPGNS